ncbi:MAG: DUF883 C-terminal domain-containing protein [Planctomycetes bacterium]|nr:DUF883 C-terminal domain-containing protein [Planctomycetota bacterium]
MADRAVDHTDIDKIKHDIGKLRDDFSGLLNTAAKAGKHSVAQAKELGGEAVEAVQEKISERPITSVLIALGVGALIGALVSRR